MKLIYASILVSSLLTSTCGTGAASASNNAASDTSAPHKRAAMSATKLPNNFTAYATESIVDGKLCIVGAATDDDGMNQKPLVYAANAETKKAIWITQLQLPPDTYQSRATHCNHSGNAVYVLLQSDTQSEQTLSQTLLRAVKLDAATGIVQAQQNIDVPNTYTAWVEEGVSHFQWQGSALVVSGSYRSKSDQDHATPFTLRLNNELSP